MTADEKEELAPLPRAISITGMSKSSIYREMKEGRFPKPIHVRRKSLWPVSRLHAWVNQQIAANEEKPK